jgi:hypothetical protein
MSPELYWDSAGNLGSLKYTCGYCGAAAASDQGWYAFDRDLDEPGEEHIRVCPHCGRPTFFETQDKQLPGIPFGRAVMHVPETSATQLYEEARRATAEGCLTESVNAHQRNSHWFKTIIGFTNIPGRRSISSPPPKGKSSLLLTLRWQHGRGANP